jgi:nitrite reductase/ring-hydroxylating ferredoxin subunit
MSTTAAAAPRYDLPPYTNGWFQVGWSDDLKRGQLRKVKQFGKSYTLFRGRDGIVGLLDDVCPHLGAHFSEGGCVKANSVRCPYHHWQFDRHGECTGIPYAKKIPPKARVGSHHVEERYGMIFMFHSREGGGPTYDLPEMPGFDPDEWGKPTKYEFAIKIHGQDIMENSVDSAHFHAVHGHNMPTNEFVVDGQKLHVTQHTSVHRFGVLLKARLIFHLVEPGFHYVDFPEMPGTSAHVFSSIVPIDEEMTNHRLTVRIHKTRIPGLSAIIRRFLLWQMMTTYHEDMRIWQSKDYLSRPVLCDGDGSIMKLRKWYRQFYDPADLSEITPAAALVG